MPTQLKLSQVGRTFRNNKNKYAKFNLCAGMIYVVIINWALGEKEMSSININMLWKHIA